MNNLNNVKPMVVTKPIRPGFEATAHCDTPRVDAFTLILDNSGGGTPTLFRLFDADGINDAISGAAGVPATSGTIAPSVITETTKSAPIMITGFNYQTTVAAAQFGNALNVVKGEINGTQAQRPNITAKAKRNTQFDPLLLTIDEPVFIDSKTAIELTVSAGETVILTFFVEAVCNRQPC